MNFFGGKLQGKAVFPEEKNTNTKNLKKILKNYAKFVLNTCKIFISGSLRRSILEKNLASCQKTVGTGKRP